MLDRISESCRFLLNNFAEAQSAKSYLDSRVSEESQELFQFGYFPNVNNMRVIIDLVGSDALVDSKLLFYKDLEDSFNRRQITFSYFEDYPIVLPFRDAYGKVVALVGRSLLSDEERKRKGGIPKYKNTTPFTKSSHLFGLYENKKSILDQNCVYIVEGQFDVIKAVEKGFKNIVAVGGSDMTAYQFSVISRYTDNIFMLLDNDEAGEKGRKRTVDKFGKLANIRNFYLPDGYKDIDEFLSGNLLDNLSFVLKD